MEKRWKSVVQMSEKRMKDWKKNNETMKDLRNRIDVRLVNIEKDYLKCTSRPKYMSLKIFENNLVVLRRIIWS